MKVEDEMKLTTGSNLGHQLQNAEARSHECLLTEHCRETREKNDSVTFVIGTTYR